MVRLCRICARGQGYAAFDILQDLIATHSCPQQVFACQSAWPTAKIGCLAYFFFSNLAHMCVKKMEKKWKESSSSYYKVQDYEQCLSFILYNACKYNSGHVQFNRLYCCAFVLLFLTKVLFLSLLLLSIPLLTRFKSLLDQPVWDGEKTE